MVPEWEDGVVAAGSSAGGGVRDCCGGGVLEVWPFQAARGGTYLVGWLLV